MSLVKINNFEVDKLLVNQPDLTNLAILIILFIVVILSLKRRRTTLGDVAHSNQAKGIAILLIIVGHLWVHVSSQKPALVFSAEGVSLFLILSGYGLTRSHLVSPYSLKQFLSKRINRVYYPYWIATVFIIGLDYLLLNRTYSSFDILLTTVGINLSQTTKHLDYARWYITFILFWYIMFYLSTMLQSKNRALLFLFAASSILLPLDYYVTHLGWYQIYSFSVGCFIGYNHKVIHDRLQAHNVISIMAALTTLATVILYKIYMFHPLRDSLPYLIFLFVREGASILFSLSIMALIWCCGQANLASRFLSFTGIISYELFLLHGPFLIKYNFFMNGKNVVFPFFIYLPAVYMLSIAFNKVAKALQRVPIKWKVSCAGGAIQPW